MSVIYGHAAAQGLRLGHPSCSCRCFSSFRQTSPSAAEIVLVEGCWEAAVCTLRTAATMASWFCWVMGIGTCQMFPVVQSKLISWRVSVAAMSDGPPASSHSQSQHAGQQARSPCLLLIVLSLSFTGPPGKRGRMGRRGEPGKYRPPPAWFVCPSSLFLSGSSFLSPCPISARRKLKGW